MRVWITPSYCNSIIRIYCKRNDATWVAVCRETVKKLLKGTGKKLPKHDSKDVVVVELTAK